MGSWAVLEEQMLAERMHAGRMPKSVLVASDELYQQIAAGPDSVDLLQSLDAMVVPYSVSPHFHELQVVAVREHLETQGQLINGSLLIKNPYDPDSFELAENAIAAFTDAKYHAMANVARLLGAVEVTLKETRVESQIEAWNAQLKGRFRIGDGKASAQREVKKKISALLDVHFVFRGGAPSLEEAREYLERRNLTNDYRLRELLEMRTGASKIIKCELKMSGTKESDSNFASGLELANAGPVKLLQIGASFTKTLQSVKNVEVTTEILFPSE